MVEVDLNLMRTFVHLYETRSVTRTAVRMSLTQPSVSYALQRLRKQFNDNLFARSSGGLVPTERAEEAYSVLRQAIEVIDLTVTGNVRFDAAESHRTFRIHATDLGEMSLLPPILAEIASAAPHVDLHITPLDMTTAVRELRQGQADAVICTPRIAAPDIARDALFRDHYCGLRRSGHDRIGPSPTLDEFLAERHIAVEVAAGHTDVDRALGLLDHTRDVALQVSHFAALPQLVAQTDHLSVIPHSVSDLFCTLAPVDVFDLPFEVPAVEVSLYTYRRTLPDSGIEWLRDAIRATVTQWGALHAGDGRGGL